MRALPESSAAPLLDAVSSMLRDTTSQHRAHLFDLNCRVCTGERKRPAPPGLPVVASSSQPDSHRQDPRHVTFFTSLPLIP